METNSAGSEATALDYFIIPAADVFYEITGIKLG